MKQAVLCKGSVIPRDVADPVLRSGGVLVKVEFSCISAGTEMSSVKNSEKNLLVRALEKPAQAKNALNILRERGFSAMMNVVKGATGAAFGNVLGYSAAGTVIDVGANAKEFYVGQRVAIAGVGYASHAGYASVPKNLVIPVPDEVSLENAATVAIGSIALQGVRRLEPVPGEAVVVMGLGIIGQLAAQMLKASGCHVIGIDLNPERLQLARDTYGIDVLNGADSSAAAKVWMLTQGCGADGVVFTAATSSSEPMSNCFGMLRRKGRFVLVGVSGMNIKREDIYAKEIDFRIATSYGPGRYDSTYEEGGIDYPYEYVRWTEKRNMETYLAQIGVKNILVDQLINGIYPVEESTAAYQALKGKGNPLIVLLSYGNSHKAVAGEREDVVKAAGKALPKQTGAITYAIVGAGSFARSMHLPNLSTIPDKYHLKAIMNRTGVSAAALAAQYHAAYSTTNIERVLKDPDIQLVMVCTRHDMHALLAIQALRAGKDVFVEKPPALNEVQLGELIQTIKETGRAYLVGYNRRFSQYAKEIRRHTETRKGKLFIEYTMNAGYIPPEHWVHSPEGGGRIIGEGCHIVDLLGYLVGCKATGVSVNHLLPQKGYYLPDDNLVATITYEDGSIATMNYIANGAAKYPKETMTAYFDGKTITMRDYMSLSAEGLSVKGIKNSAPSKGQREEMVEFYQLLQSGCKYPIPLEEIEQTSRITFEVTNSVRQAYLRLNDCASKDW